jgi:methylmalonyl-CoA/ethylmalonyl-CoA epimerase
MGDVQELRLVLTVSDFDAAVALYRDALGLAELADWSDGDAKIVVLDEGVRPWSSSTRTRRR